MSNANGNRTKVVLPRSYIRQSNGTFILSSLGEVSTSYAYTGRNLVASATEADGSMMAWTYSLTGKKQSETRQLAAGRFATTSFIYGGCCDRLSDVVDPYGSSTHYEYDAVGQVISVTDANGNPTATTYDALRRVTTRTNAEGNMTAYVYDDNLTDGQGVDADVPALVAGLGFGPGAAGSAVKVTDPTGGVAIQIQDSLGRVVRSQDANGQVSSIAYDQIDGGTGLVTTVSTDPLGHTVTVYADAAGHPRQTRDAESQMSLATYDAAGRPLGTRDPNSVGFDAVFDGLGRETQRTDTAGATILQQYDTAGNVVRRRDALAKWSSSTYDLRNRKLSDTDANGNTTIFVYDLAGRLATITDAEGKVTTYLYDDVDRLVQETYPAGEATPGQGQDTRVYTYDGAGRLTSRLDQAGVLTSYLYDKANRLLFRRYPDGRNDAFTYDASGRLLSATSNRYASTVARQYDAGGRLSSETQTIDGLSYQVGYGYFADNTVASVAYPNGQTAFRAYTPRRLLSHVWYGANADAAASIAMRAYDPGGRLTTTSLANGLNEVRTYTANDNMVRSIDVLNVISFTYGYDADKRKTSETGSDNQSFGYDDASRLTSWTGAGNTIKSWALSPVGDWNTLTTTVQGQTPTIESRTHSDVHETTGINRGSGILPLIYDSRGNLTRDEQGQAYAWDVENRLASARIPRTDLGCTVTALYRHDALGRRVQKIVGGIATTYIHDGAQVIEELGGTAAWSPSSTTSGQSALPSGTSPDQATTHGQILDDVLVKVNWQPVGAVPDGYVGDTGAAKPDGSDPYLFGWDTAPADSSRRNAEALPELDTGIKTGSAQWQINLPDGTYPVVVLAGDPLVPTGESQTNNVTIAGQSFVDPDPYPAASSSYGRRGDFDGYFAQATVSDGMLTIAPGAGMQNMRLCFVEIGPRGPLTDAQVAAIQARLTDFLTKAKARTAQPPTAPAPEKDYVYGSYVDEPLMQVTRSGASYVKQYLHANHLYSVAAVTDASGNVVERYRYDAYGKRTVLDATGLPKSGNGVTIVAFTGRTIDDETGLMYFRARMYSVTLGRFVGRDPINEGSPMGGYQDGMGLYDAYYVPNEVDPEGLGVFMLYGTLTPIPRNDLADKKETGNTSTDWSIVFYCKKCSHESSSSSSSSEEACYRLKYAGGTGMIDSIYNSRPEAQRQARDLLNWSTSFMQHEQVHVNISYVYLRYLHGMAKQAEASAVCEKKEKCDARAVKMNYDFNAGAYENLLSLQWAWDQADYRRNPPDRKGYGRPYSGNAGAMRAYKYIETWQ